MGSEEVAAHKSTPTEAIRFFAFLTPSVGAEAELLWRAHAAWPLRTLRNAAGIRSCVVRPTRLREGS
jgi:hypothetical protein